MKQMTKLAVALAATLGLAAQAQANVTGHQSDETYVKVGATLPSLAPGHGGPGGEPGIGVHSIGNKTIVSFSGLQRYVTPDSNNITVIKAAPESHRDLGEFNFGKIANTDVYVGEWSQTGNVTDGTHSVYYAGTDKTTAMPTSGRASYRVSGINNYNGSNLYSGTLNANFSQNTLAGSISRGFVGANVVSIEAKINSANASFAGSAKHSTNWGVTNQNGQTQGHFFGNNAQSLAGVATFADRSKDVAFGGIKN